MPIRAIVVACSLAVGPVALAGAPVVAELEPDQDTSIYSISDGSNGAGPGLFTGRSGSTGGEAPMRALLRFDLSSIPAGADIVSVELRLFQERAAIGSGNRTLTLHRLTASWGEAGSFSNMTSFGAPPQEGDASWTKRFHPDVFWTTPGGDFDPAPSASAVSPSSFEVPVTWSGPGLADDVEDWLETPADNHGWILVGDESEIQTGRRFASRETSNLDGVPTLVVTYETGGSGCPGDFDGDGMVGFSDLLTLLAAWGTVDPGLDLDGNGTVGFGDLLEVLAAFGPC